MKAGDTLKNEIKDLIIKNLDCRINECSLCANRCRDCLHLEIENNYYKDDERRCDYKGTWVRLSDPACGNFSY